MHADYYAGMKTSEEFPWDAVFRVQGMSVRYDTNHFNMDKKKIGPQ